MSFCRKVGTEFSLVAGLLTAKLLSLISDRSTQVELIFERALEMDRYNLRHVGKMYAEKLLSNGEVYKIELYLTDIKKILRSASNISIDALKSKLQQDYISGDVEIFEGWVIAKIICKAGLFVSISGL